VLGVFVRVRAFARQRSGAEKCSARNYSECLILNEAAAPATAIIINYQCLNAFNNVSRWRDLL
jgi:hypothetical protein